MKILTYIIASLIIMFSTASAGDLSIVNGQYSHKGQVGYRAIGINYFDAISRSINRPGDRSALHGMRMLARYQVPFVRVMFGGFWPNELKLYQTDPDRYFLILDEFVAIAESFGIGLIPSLAWNYAAIPDLVGEPMSAWGVADSKTHVFFRKYVSDVVTRYHKSPAIWMWEFGNEMALRVDLPNREKFRPQVDVSKGTPPTRSASDDLRGADQAVALQAFVKSVRAIDAVTPLSTGNALPRPYAYHNSKFGTWQSDNKEQFCDVLGRDNPAGYDVISVHIYPDAKGYFEARDYDHDAILAPLKNCSVQLNKPIFAGEFGVSDKELFNGIYDAKRGFDIIIDSIFRNQVGLAAVWVFDFNYQIGTYNVTATNGRSYQLEQINNINRSMRAIR